VPVRIREFAIGERAAEKFWMDGITRRQVEEMLLNRLVITVNRKGRPASHLAIGRDNQGRCITAPILPTSDPGIWRPVTAWPCKPGEAAKLR
jgi:hypothetical protein